MTQPLSSEGDVPLTNVCRVSLEEALAYTRGRPIGRVVPIIYQTATDLGIDPAFAIAEAILETGWGTSKLAQNRHNWYGYQAYFEEPSKARSFASDEEGIRAALQEMAHHYFSPSGRYYADGDGATLLGWAAKWVGGNAENWQNAVRHIGQLMRSMIENHQS